MATRHGAARACLRQRANPTKTIAWNRGMEPAGKQFLIGSAIVWSCDGPMVVEAISKNLAGGCSEFWLNRYQGMHASFVALVGAWITVRAMLSQAETTRADDAERRLSRYAGVVLDVMQKYTETSGSVPARSDPHGRGVAGAWSREISVTPGPETTHREVPSDPHGERFDAADVFIS